MTVFISKVRSSENHLIEMIDMSWESTLKALNSSMNQNSGEFPSRMEITRMRESYNKLLKIRNSMVEVNGRSKYPDELIRQLPTMREVDDMLSSMQKIVNATWDKYLVESGRPAFMDRAQEALRQQRMAK